jgi:tight adherence protein C
MINEGHIPFLIATLAFIVIFLFFIGILRYIREHTTKHEMLEKIRKGYGKEELVLGTDTNGQNGGTTYSKFMNILSIIGSSVLPEESETYSDMKLKFLRAGFRSAKAPFIFWGVKILIMVLLPIVFFLTRLTILPPLNTILTIAAITYLALFGFYLPNVWLRIHTIRRKNQLMKGIPDALDLLVVCVEAGMGLNAAINRVGEEMRLSNKVISDEFKLLNLEMRMGMSRQAALRNLALRTDVEEIRTLCTLLIQTERFGTSIGTALRTCSDGSRSRRFQQAEEMAAKMAVKLSFPVIFCIFPSLFIVILGPAAIRIYQVLFIH